MKQTMVIFLMTATALVFGLAAKADRGCESWVGSAQAALLGKANFKFRVYDHPQKPVIAKDITILCSLILPKNEEHTLSRLCIDGEVAAAVPYLAGLATQERGAHGRLMVSKFSFDSASLEGAVFSATTMQPTGYIRPVVNCEGCAPTPVEVQDDTNCGDAGTCSAVKSEWTPPISRRILVPACNRLQSLWY